MPGLEVGQVAEILVTIGAGKPGRRGSGYRVTAQTVLTAEHVVRGASTVRVRFDAHQAGEWSADVTGVLEIPEIDVALLTITPTGVGQVVPAQFGLIGERDAVIECSAVGFPLWKLRGDPAGKYRDSAHVVGSGNPLANRREGTLEITVPPPERDTDPDVSPWQGMSGAAVFRNGRIVGIIRKHHRTDGLGRLAASRVDSWKAQLTPSRLQDMIALLPQLEDVIMLSPGNLREVAPVMVQPAAVRADSVAQLLDPQLGVVPFFGRADECAGLRAWCADEHAGKLRIVTGAGGVGKTRLALWLDDALSGRGWECVWVRDGCEADAVTGVYDQARAKYANRGVMSTDSARTGYARAATWLTRSPWRPGQAAMTRFSARTGQKPKRDSASPAAHHRGTH